MKTKIVSLLTLLSVSAQADCTIGANIELGQDWRAIAVPHIEELYQQVVFAWLHLAGCVHPLIQGIFPKTGE